MKSLCVCVSVCVYVCFEHKIGFCQNGVCFEHKMGFCHNGECFEQYYGLFVTCFYLNACKDVVK